MDLFASVFYFSLSFILSFFLFYLLNFFPFPYLLLFHSVCDILVVSCMCFYLLFVFLTLLLCHWELPLRFRMCKLALDSLCFEQAPLLHVLTLAAFTDFKCTELKIYLLFADGFMGLSYSFLSLYIHIYIYEDVSKSFRTGRLERELQIVHLSAARCCCDSV
jgi:hypothetical protein